MYLLFSPEFIYWIDSSSSLLECSMFWISGSWLILEHLSESLMPKDTTCFWPFNSSSSLIYWAFNCIYTCYWNNGCKPQLYLCSFSSSVCWSLRMPELFSLLDSAVGSAAFGLTASLLPPPNMFLPLFRLGDIFGDVNLRYNCCWWQTCNCWARPSSTVIFTIRHACWISLQV